MMSPGRLPLRLRTLHHGIFLCVSSLPPCSDFYELFWAEETRRLIQKVKQKKKVLSYDDKRIVRESVMSVIVKLVVLTGPKRLVGKIYTAHLYVCSV